ncbi:hypothetical protein [Arthrobacter sp. 3Tela_A]
MVGLEREPVVYGVAVLDGTGQGVVAFADGIVDDDDEVLRRV